MGKLFRFKRDFDDDCCGARGLEFSRSHYPALQTFGQWLAENKSRIPLEQDGDCRRVLMIRSAKLSLCVLVVAATFGACGEEPTEPRPGESFTLAPGESVLLEAAALRVGFRAIGSDSRCPLRAECVWAGDGSVVLELAPLDGAQTEDILHTNTAIGPGSVDLGRFELALVALHPHPEVPGGIEPEDYRVTLVLNDRGARDSP